MKTSLVIASVLLAGVALEVAAYRINNNDNQGENNQWIHSQQQNSNGASFDEDRLSSNLNIQDSQNARNNKQFNERMNNYNSYDSSFTDHSRQNSQNYESAFGYRQENTAEQQYRTQNQAAFVGQSTGLTRKMIEKIAAFQKIAQRTQHFDNALSINKDAIKLSEHNFVTFYNATMQHLNNGELEYAYINLPRDICLAQYQFKEIETVGSFKSNVQNANLGYFNIVMHQMTSNVSTGIDNDQLAAIEPARFQYAEAIIKTEDGAETPVFNDALKHRYLGVLEKALSAEVAKSVNRGMIAQMKYEIRKPMVFNDAEKKGKLFDMRWKEDDVSMEMSNIGFQNAENVAKPMQFNVVSFYRKSENQYRMRYLFTLNNLEWTSPLTVEYAGKKMTIRSADVKIDEANVHITINKSYGQQQSYGQANTHIEVSGLRYNFNENVPSEFMSKIENKLQRFIEHSLEYYIQESLKQELFNINKY